MSRIEKAAASQMRSLLHDQAKKISSHTKVSGNWHVAPLLSRQLYGLWLAGWKLGQSHAKQEIKDVGKFSQFAQFEAESASIKNPQAEKAIRDRINTLSGTVSNQEFDRIKQHLAAAVTPQRDTEQPIDRKELERRIDTELGPDSRWSGRAETIARTELTFAYNAGRLASYRESGLVEAVTFFCISDERTCPVCASRNGIIISLSDTSAIAANTPPLHPRCRCVLSPRLAPPKKREEADNIENRSLAARPEAWMAAGILAAVLLGTLALANRRSIPAVAIAAEKATEKIVDNVAKNTVNQTAIKIIATAINQKNSIKTVSPQQPELATVSSSGEETPSTPKLMVLGIDLNTATREQLQSLLPGRQLNNRQITAIIRYLKTNPIEDINDLSRVPEIGKLTVQRFKELYEENLPTNLLNQVTNPIQLWASNLGLTKPQARAIYEELQNGAFQDIEDLRIRLKGKGIGPRTVKNLEERAILIQQNAQKPVRVQAQNVIVKPISPPEEETNQ